MPRALDRVLPRPVRLDAGAGGAATDLVERHEELEALKAWHRRAQDGRGGLVLLTGEPGAGKTTLLQAFGAAPTTTPILWGACDPLTTPRPLGPLQDVAAHLGDDARAALREGDRPHEIFAAVHEHLRAHPSVLVVDDLHWADQGTIDLLRFLLRRIAATSSLVIGALRDEELDRAHPLRSLLGDVARSSDATTLALRPFSVDAIATLIRERRADTEPDGTEREPADAGRIAELTGGNPFFVTEMLHHAGDDLPTSVRDAVLARTTGLDTAAWELLHLLTCSPEAIPDHLLATLGIGFTPLRALDQAGLVRRGRRGVTFRHDLCRMAIAGALPPGGDAPVHRRMLDALEATPGADPAVLAHHALGAGDPWRILRHASAAGRAAERSGAHTQAAAFLRTALDSGPPLAPADEAELLESLAAESYLIDRMDDAIAASEAALALRARAGDATGTSGNHHALAMYHWYDADRVAADHHAAQAVAVLGGEEGDAGEEGARSGGGFRHLGHALAMQAYLALQSTDVAGALALVARAQRFAGDDPVLSMRCRLIEGICSVANGVRGAREATLALLDAADLDQVRSSGYSNVTYLDVEQRRLPDADDLLRRSLPLAVERDLPICRAWQLGARARLELLTGDWAAALADVDAVLSGATAKLARTWPHLVRGLVVMRRDAAGFEDDLDAAWSLATQLGEPIRLLPVAAALVERAWLLGGDDDRTERCTRLLEAAHVGLDWARGDLAVWLRRLDPAGELGGPGDLDGLAEPHQLELAGRHREAAELWGSLSCPYERALALVGSDDPDDARRGLDELDRLGAVAVAAKVRRDLRRRGVAALPSGRRTATRRNPAGLTNRELEVLRLLAESLTNAELAERLFISPKTVDHHVSAVLGKLHVANRRDAVRRGRAERIIA